jgi:hypothetical protein
MRNADERGQQYGKSKLDTSKKTSLPLPDAAVDVALSSTVFEAGDAEPHAVGDRAGDPPGGRIDIIVCAIDMPFWVGNPYGPAEAP